MILTPKSMRLQIGLFGRTNVGKSSFLNMVAGQDVAVTSPIPGTTTDVVEKAMELLPVGPVMFLDTGGMDDDTRLAAERLARTRRVFDRAEVFILLVEAGHWTDYESAIIAAARQRRCPCLIVVNKIDDRQPEADFLQMLQAASPFVCCVSSRPGSPRDRYVSAFKALLIQALPEGAMAQPPILGDLLPPGGLAVLIVPIDPEAPKGRLILPQVQTIRDALDYEAATLVVNERQYRGLLNRLSRPPDLVVCDSQVVMQMVVETPAGIPCTTFSILFARLKGDLCAAARGAEAIDNLVDGDRVLVAEACTHHPVEDDIGRVKIPRWLRERTGCELQIDTYSGRDYPDNLEDYRLIVHCGACMLTRREMLARIQRASAAGVPITNYGVCVSALHQVLQRVLEPFPEAWQAYENPTQPNTMTSIPSIQTATNRQGGFSCSVQP
ncbi:[FeFe] hydrogenase H-cluster maturation GTPase HydF [uncultured Desulfosarcina sp.]|uniref:[FeFe] hydrogenase H-cluster maturation GTPase HydF n=1 Tax=uncultured Desulfosarcina sp. TaxID=218289 RepID=UPI0029C895D2|nr:[FeFe] hydrogenase H-cluster maturation GTPase HydF [uncultured Desulfosarcina sp.]